jgi:DNA primase large subunit
MNTQEEAGMDKQELERLLRELLAANRLPSYIKSARYEFSTDQYGEPAVRIFLTITPETDEILSKDKTKLKDYSDYKQNLAGQILKLESGYFPFIRLVEAS